MRKIKVLNGYAGIGGNRKHWKNVKVVAIENNPLIASIYADNFPKDKVIVGDAHEYIRNHYSEFDFIWSSRPCKSHSKARYLATVFTNRSYEPIYPDLRLYEEIIFLKHFFKGKWIVENVKPFYKPLIKPQLISKHALWANFIIPKIKLSNRYHFNTVEELQQEKGFDLSNIKSNPGELNKVKILRNCVHPKLGLHIFNCAFKIKQLTL